MQSPAVALLALLSLVAMSTCVPLQARDELMPSVTFNNIVMPNNLFDAIRINYTQPGFEVDLALNFTVTNNMQFEFTLENLTMQGLYKTSIVNDPATTLPTTAELACAKFSNVTSFPAGTSSNIVVPVTIYRSSLSLTDPILADIIANCRQPSGTLTTSWKGLIQAKFQTVTSSGIALPFTINKSLEEEFKIDCPAFLVEQALKGSCDA